MAINKIINVNDGSGREFTENTVAELKFDTKPEVGSFNAVTSDAVARAVAGVSGGVPQVTENDNGKVLTASYDAGGPSVSWEESQGGSTYTEGNGISLANDTISVRHDSTLTDVGGRQTLTPSIEFKRSYYSSAYGGWRWCAYAMTTPIEYLYSVSFTIGADSQLNMFDRSMTGKQVVGILVRPTNPTKYLVVKLHDSNGNNVYTEATREFCRLKGGTYSIPVGSDSARIHNNNIRDDGEVIVNGKSVVVIGLFDQDLGRLITDPDSFADGPLYNGVPLKVFEIAETTVVSSDQYTPVEPGPDAVWSWQTNEPITTGEGTASISVANPFPEYSSVDNGRVLKVNNGNAVWEYEIPPYNDEYYIGRVLGVVGGWDYPTIQWVKPTKVEYANQELTVQPPNGASPLTIDVSDATPVPVTEPYSEYERDFVSSTLVVVFNGYLGEKNLTSCTLHIPDDIVATGITLNDLEFNYYSGGHGEYTEESISPMVVTGAISASPSKILAGDYVVPLVPNPDSVYGTLCVKITYSGSPDQADLAAFISALDDMEGVRNWSVTGDVQVASGYSIKPAVLPDITGQAGKVLTVNSGATGTEWDTVDIPSYTAGDGIKIESNTVSAYHGETLVDKVLPLAFKTGADSRTAWYPAFPQTVYTALKVEFGDIVPNNTMLLVSIKTAYGTTVGVANPSQVSVDPDLGGKKVKLVFANPDNPSNYIEAVSAANVEVTQTYNSMYQNYSSRIELPAELFYNNFQDGFNWHGLTLADIQGADGSTLMYVAVCASDGTLVTTGSYGPTHNLWTVGFGTSSSADADTYALVTMPSNPVGFDVKNPVPDTGSAVVGSVLAKGFNGLEWVAGGVPYYIEDTSSTVGISCDNSVVTSTADVTRIYVNADVKSAVVQWTVASTTTLPTVVDSSNNPLKAAVNNPSSLTVGRTVQVSILNGTWVCAEFA